MNNDKSLVLIADDNSDNLQILGNMLKESGFRPAASENGEEALKFAARMKPDIILFDLLMPGMDGFEFFEQLKKEESAKDIPVIFIISMNDIEERLRVFKAGGTDFITKPFVREEVFARIGAQLEIKRLREKMS